jgi:uncharacterized protein (DUF427 family)
MSLTLGSGPLAGTPGGSFNFEFNGAPPHRIFFEAYPRRLRALVGDRVVLDTVGAQLLHETGILPRVYVPVEDVDASVLERTDTSTHCPFKGDASYWTLRVGDRVIEDAVWAYEQPLEAASWLAGYASVYPDKVDAWFCEDEPLFGHLRDPYHRVDVYETARTVRVRVDGDVVAESGRAKLLYETGIPVRAYVPAADVRPGVLSPSDTRTVCPYKGEASYWHVQAGGRRVEDAAWSYETPLPEALDVARHLSFWGDEVDVEIADPADRFTMGR